MNWLGWLIVGVIAVAFVAVVVSEIVKRKNGKGGCSCGGSCEGCAMKGACHPNQPK